MRFRSAVVKLVLAAVAIGAVEFFYGWGELFGLVEKIAQSNNDSLAIFFFLMSVGCALAFPLSFCYLFAGAAFGFGRGWAVCVAVLAVSSAIGYLLGRFLFPSAFIEKICRRIGIKEDSGTLFMFNANFLVRVVPGIPYWVQNVVLGGIRSNFVLYMLVNLAAQGAIAGAMTFLGSSVSGKGNEKYYAFAILVAVLAVFHIGVNFAYRRFSRKNEKEGTDEKL